MAPIHAVLALLPPAERALKRCLYGLGGLGLIPLGLVDNSPLPLAGTLDTALVVLTVRQDRLWLYYALMATAGAVIGGFVTFQLARKGGKEALERRFSRRKVEKVHELFVRWGFGAVAVPALLPPPVPMLPFLLAAGATDYPAWNFLAALSSGRMLRYLILAYLAARYGRQIMAFIAKNGHPAAVAIVLALLAAAAVVFYFRGGRGRG